MDMGRLRTLFYCKVNMQVKSINNKRAIKENVSTVLFFLCKEL